MADKHCPYNSDMICYAHLTNAGKGYPCQLNCIYNPYSRFGQRHGDGRNDWAPPK